MELNKEKQQKRRQDDWLRLLGQYTSISRNKRSIIDEEREKLNQNILNDWYMIEQSK